MVTLEDVRRIAMRLPRTTEGIVRGSVRWRIGGIVYAAVTADETLLGFGFPKEEREGLVGGEPTKFVMPRTSDLRFNWVTARMDALDEDEMLELVVDGWRMVVPKKVWSTFDERTLR
ncbi:MAG: hypothetical protein JWL72_2912 [Ilumatobacteraceae bacterium]|nr:hypothetical protein [Ilumatobacteraceae bacterium]